MPEAREELSKKYSENFESLMHKLRIHLVHYFLVNKALVVQNAKIFFGINMQMRCCKARQRMSVFEC